MLSKLDTLTIEFDTGLRTLLAKPRSIRAHPDAGVAETDLSECEKNQASALMRVNHTGEVCAQALYSGQALTAHRPETTAALKQAAIEETEHLAWCESRITELGGRTSLLNPLFYAGSFTMGVIAGALGDKWNLGFLAETEKQVGEHLANHLEKLPQSDQKTRRIIQQMQLDEAKHASEAKQYGAAELPAPAKFLMKKVSKLMTTSSYYL
ncbi:2-polyprenyl-3-methyl-6-methoxy-1,4-benzoquinone monooxygenase [Methylotenera sp.]|uniref:2-polyprenyl-3-methyl-6-methoxy-1,4-benzoquinone monooxygenase n=1 Tax=Methylotenera sp. TaxID=2051956 RepID=UPI00271B72CB|nr:2-polyprenyl-3-methyl-6-methoxy-1,4-benzoquinone monooxygenase [Methylotenera sp.]MDO9205572.1 2-polyprenyl-3-methyl-6-methoxy-1,4-benzoquinone monooxygenase [Methylotenera sp.]MDP1659240.1 2-polyprenyl-3-methyl-6-methoxy-1,4-benzoquinone monooxygenase [Methylotenera sp.]MDP2229988.1 2-polyprenyl-3-methyl-6-methoxy-1,4-benzoquinone monooxygenase [Methylotenera sp.]MDP3006459.1 2-polyprenyl-3-methyl-6-methoxy-1,4-benzoquinone monooxygenase [Methylotenera sp.]MDP3140551.1 2-polyprenyl-3-methy